MPKQRKNKRRSQKIYRMRGCNKTRTNKRRKYLGGSGTNLNLAYSSNNVPTMNNPNLAYTGKGGAVYPNPGPNPSGFNFLNSQQMRGGDCGCNKMFGGGTVQPMPSSFVGAPWTANSSGNSNYFAANKYPVDPQTNMKSVGANPPFLGGRRGTRRQRGGAFVNTLGQDFINAGRQLGHGFGNIASGLKGTASSANPLPYKNQLPHKPHFVL